MVKVLSDISLIEKYDIKDGVVLRVENDDWGVFLRVVDEAHKTLHSKMVYDESKLDDHIQDIIDMFK